MYQYSGLDKVTSISEGEKVISSYNYSISGQLASATTDGATESFLWDGLALIRRGDTDYTNEPYVTGGNPLLSSDGKIMFNDVLGNTVGIKSDDKLKLIKMTAFGETADKDAFFTGKPAVNNLGYSFLFRNYRADQGKWQTSDPMGYPDGWNNLAYCNSRVTTAIDWLGWATLTIHSSSSGNASSYNTSGHSWVSYTDNNNKTTTYGTWGNVPKTNNQSGFYEDLEKGRPSDSSRSFEITDPKQQEALNKTLEKYRAKGEDAWSPTDPCTDFALDVWDEVTGEDLGSFWPWDTPSDLQNNIKKANGGNAHGTYKPNISE